MVGVGAHRESYVGALCCGGNFAFHIDCIRQTAVVKDEWFTTHLFSREYLFFCLGERVYYSSIAYSLPHAAVFAILLVR